jgi:hypothetical protein
VADKATAAIGSRVATILRLSIVFSRLNSGLAPLRRLAAD